MQRRRWSSGRPKWWQGRGLLASEGLSLVPGDAGLWMTPIQLWPLKFKFTTALGILGVSRAPQASSQASSSCFTALLGGSSVMSTEGPRPTCGHRPLTRSFLNSRDLLPSQGNNEKQYAFYP